MIRALTVVLFGLALTCAAQAIPFVPAHHPMAALARMGCGPGMVVVNGACVARSTIKHDRARDGMEAFALGGTN